MLVRTNLVILLALFVSARTGAQLLEDHFVYTNGNLGAAGVGNAVWTGGDSPASALTVNSSAALTNAALFAPSGSGVIYNGGTFKKKAAPFAPQSGSGTTVFVSFLVQVQSAPGTVKPMVYLQNGNSASSSPPLGIFLNASTQVGLAKFAGSPAVTSASLSAGVHLIVARYSFLAGNDQVDLWVDPMSLGTNTIPAATLTTGAGSSSDAPALSYVFLNHAAAQTVWLDELRVGNTWASVTPTDGATLPPPSGAPLITQVFRLRGNIVLQGTNGAPSGPYAVLSATSLGLAIKQWPVIGSNVFDSLGRFASTNPISSGEPVRFYAIRSGTNTSPPAPDAPQVTDQPENLALTQGQDAIFSVAATGTAPLFTNGSSTPIPPSQRQPTRRTPSATSTRATRAATR